MIDTTEEIHQDHDEDKHNCCAFRAGDFSDQSDPRLARWRGDQLVDVRQIRHERHAHHETKDVVCECAREHSTWEDVGGVLQFFGQMDSRVRSYVSSDGADYKD